MTKADVQQLVLAIRAIQKKNGDASSEQTILDHLTAIKSFWKWLIGSNQLHYRTGCLESSVVPLSSFGGSLSSIFILHSPMKMNTFPS